MSLSRYIQRLARLDTLAARYEPRTRVAIIRACETSAEAAAAGASPEVAAGLVRMLFVQDVLSDMIERCGVAEATEEYDYLTRTYQKALPGAATVASWAARLRRYISTEAATSLRAISATIRGKVRAVLQQAADEGLGARDAASLLRSEVATFSVKQAEAIVRTELIGASNAASLMGAEATGLRLRKVWLATPGPRTRPTHREAGGQVTSLASSFTVGGFPARYPGDPLLPASERIRCRCSITYEPVD